MRLWIDVREACRERKTGKGQWVLRMVGALLAIPGVEATLVTDAPVPEGWSSLPGFAGVRTVDAPGLRWHVRVRSMLLRERASIDAYLSPTSFIVPFLVGRRVPTVPVVHDLIAFRNEPHDRKATFIERLTLPRALRTAAAVCAVSAATAELLRRRFPHSANISVVGAGPTVDERGTWNGRTGHVLCIGTLCPRKNQWRLLLAYGSLPEETRAKTPLLLVGGRGWHDEDIVALAKDTPGASWLGFQSDDTCAELLRTCGAFAFVSEEEGFGLPVLDALRVGAPLLASDIPTNREVAADCATYVDPRDVASIAEGMSSVLSARHAPDAGIVRSDTFGWTKTASAVVDACRMAVDKHA